MLELDSVTVAYGEAVALADVSLVVGEGQIVALVGANGAGKTTLVKAVMGMVPVRQGRVSVAGQDLAEVGPADMPALKVALVPEGRRLFPQLSVLDNLRMGAFHPDVRHQLDTGLDQVLEMFPNLRNRTRQTAGTLSGGEQQMVAIARALISEPRLLLMDEPSLGLAPIIVAQVFDTIERIKTQGVTVMLAEQNSHKALGCADHGYVLDDGRIVMDGTGEELLAAEDVRKAYLGG